MALKSKLLFPLAPPPSTDLTNGKTQLPLPHTNFTLSSSPTASTTASTPPTASTASTTTALGQHVHRPPLLRLCESADITPVIRSRGENEARYRGQYGRWRLELKRQLAGRSRGLHGRDGCDRSLNVIYAEMLGNRHNSRPCLVELSNAEKGTREGLLGERAY